LRVGRKLRLSGIKEPHTRLKMLLTDSYPKVLKSLGLRHRSLFHHIELVIFPAGVFKGDFASIKFQFVVEPLLKQFFNDIRFYEKLFKNSKKEIKRKKEEVGEFLLEEFLKAFKEFGGENSPIIILLDLLLNTGDLYRAIVIDSKNALRVFPLIDPNSGVKKIIRKEENVCKEFVRLATDVADSIYNRFKLLP